MVAQGYNFYVFVLTTVHDYCIACVPFINAAQVSKRFMVIYFVICKMRLNFGQVVNNDTLHVRTLGLGINTRCENQAPKTLAGRWHTGTVLMHGSAKILD